MAAYAWLGLSLFLLLSVVLIPLTGEYCAAVLSGRRVPLFYFMRPIEVWIYRAAGIDRTGDGESGEMDWKEYAFSVFSFSIAGILLVTLLQRAQQGLPLHPQVAGPAPWLVSINSAISYVANANWHPYSGQTTLIYLAQVLSHALLNFAGAAVAIAVVAALARGLARRQSSKVGNFWGDLVRVTLYVLLPVSVIVAILLIGQGAVQGAFKQSGTGGGIFGMYGANPFGNFMQYVRMLIMPASVVYSFGVLINKRLHCAALLAAMFFIFMFGMGFNSRPAAKGHADYRRISAHVPAGVRAAEFHRRLPFTE